MTGRNIGHFHLRGSYTTVSGFPISNDLKAPVPIISTKTSWMDFLKSCGLMQSMAPTFLAFSNLFLLMFTPMILAIPAALQPMITDRLIPPRPNTAQVEPGVT